MLSGLLTPSTGAANDVRATVTARSGSAAPPRTASHPRRMATPPTTATTPAATVGHHCSRAKNIVNRSRSRRPSRQSFLADAPIASARLPNTMKQARAPATLGKVTSDLAYEGASRAPVFRTSRPRACRDCRSQSPRNGRATISAAMLATPRGLVTPHRTRSWSSDPAQTRPSTLTRTDCTAMTVCRPTRTSAGSAPSTPGRQNDRCAAPPAVARVAGAPEVCASGT